MKQNVSMPLTDSQGQTILQLYESLPDAERIRFSEHHHTEIELCYVLCGKGVFKIRGQHYEISPGALFFFLSNEVHWIEEIDRDNPPRFLDLKAEPRMVWSPQFNLFGDNCLRALSTLEHRCFYGKDEPISHEIGSIMKEMHEECLRNKLGCEIVVKSDLYRLLVLLLRQSGTSNLQASPRNAENLKNIDKAIQYINENLTKKFTLEELAEISCFSRTYFSALFKELNGVSPWDYINIKRVERAKALLSGTDCTVLSAANECGFGNLSNFNRIFKKITGKTPSEYRK